MKFYFDVRGDKIVAREDYSFVEGNENTYEAVFTFDDAWYPDMARQCICEVKGKRYVMPITSGSCLLPEMVKGSSYIGVIGVITDYDLVARISTNMITFGVSRGAYNGEVGEEFKSAAEVWEIYLSDMEKSRQAAEAAADRAEEQADRIKNLDVSAEEGIQAAVSKTETKDGISLKFTLPKGEKGDEGPKGDTGERGPQGIQGPKGDKGDQGDRGPKGEKGADGYTPVKGVDYFTPEDIAELNIPSKEYLETIENEASSAKGEAMANTAFRLETSPKLEKLREDVDIHQRWLEYNDGKHVNFEEDITNLKNQIGDINTALENIISIQNTLIGGESV